MSTKRKPQSLLEAIRYFSDLDVCTDFVAKLRWPNGPVCPRCGSAEYSYLTTRRLWKCKNRECRKQYSVKLGTIFEDSPLGLDKWLPAVWLIANSKNGISSHELARSLGITQKSSWFMLHRIRLAMQTGSFSKLSGEVEVDETYVGGKAHNMHAADRKRRARRGRASQNKTAVMGMRERRAARFAPRFSEPHQQGNAAARPPLRRARLDRLHGCLESLRGLGADYDHEVIDHAEAYVDGRIHTNGIENFWSLVKRGLHGTYISVDADHLFRYLDERVFTYNLRDERDSGRFEAL